MISSPKKRALLITYFALIFLFIVSSVASENFTRITDPNNELATTTLIRPYYTGCTWVDYDHDGDLDFFAINRSTGSAAIPNLLYRNDGGGTFVRITGGVLVTTSGYFFSSTWGDYDNDGDIDCYAAGNPPKLFKNDGAGNFSLESSADLVGAKTRTLTAGWADYDNDGYLDLCQAVPTWMAGPPGTFQTVPRLFHNNGPPNYDFTLIDTGAIHDAGFHTYINISWADYDLDGDQDLFIASGSGTLDSDNLFKNMLTETGNPGFIQYFEPPLGTDSCLGQQYSWEDIDNDGDLDGFLTSWLNIDQVSDIQGVNIFYRNINDSLVRYTTDEIVLIDTSASSANVWGDYDNDGDVDCIVTNDINYPLRYYRNNGDGSFTAVLTGELPNTDVHSTGASVGDYDDDGDLDFVTVGPDTNTAFFRNDNSNGNNWKKIVLKGMISNKSAIGARVFLHALINGTQVWQTRELSASNSFFGHNALIIHFGLGDANVIDTVKINWPSGQTDYYYGLSINTTDTLIECVDYDLDGICDDMDPCPGDTLNDGDFDGVCTIIDNCPDISNPGQEDTDNDGIGDACCCVGIRGNIDDDSLEVVDISDLVYLVDFMFSSGSISPCPAESNVDGDIGNVVDISDLVYLVEFLFNSGPSPASC